MVRVLDVDAIRKVVMLFGIEGFFGLLIDALETQFRRWPAFTLCPRHATHYEQGVIELMPCSDERFYSVKYVNGHPLNPHQGKLSVVAMGMLVDAKTGYPLLISEMTLLTALRTAATAAMAARYLARADSRCLAIIGNGAQSEFVIKAFESVFTLEEVRFYDIDTPAMQKFQDNLQTTDIELYAARSIDDAIQGADIIVTATAAKKQQQLFQAEAIQPGVFIHAMGGDCPAKTELPETLLDKAKVYVEYLPQSLIEGEIQQRGSEQVFAELWEVVSGIKPGRESDSEITLFDCVGFAVEDFAVLELIYNLADKYKLGHQLPMIPEPHDAKDLYRELFNNQ